MPETNIPNPKLETLDQTKIRNQHFYEIQMQHFSRAVFQPLITWSGEAEVDVVYQGCGVETGRKTEGLISPGMWLWRVTSAPVSLAFTPSTFSNTSIPLHTNPLASDATDCAIWLQMTPIHLLRSPLEPLEPGGVIELGWRTDGERRLIRQAQPAGLCSFGFCFFFFLALWCRANRTNERNQRGNRTRGASSPSSHVHCKILNFEQLPQTLGLVLDWASDETSSKFWSLAVFSVELGAVYLPPGEPLAPS